MGDLPPIGSPERDRLLETREEFLVGLSHAVDRARVVGRFLSAQDKDLVQTYISQIEDGCNVR